MPVGNFIVGEQYSVPAPWLVGHAYERATVKAVLYNRQACVAETVSGALAIYPKYSFGGAPEWIFVESAPWWQRLLAKLKRTG